METLNELKTRFGVAFQRFSSEQTELRRLQDDVPEQNVTVWIHALNAQTQRLSEVEREYKAVRLAYITRLLPRT
jgi:hypothetical protein